MPSFYQRIQSALKAFSQDTNPEYNKVVYSYMGNGTISNNENDDNYIRKGYQKNPTIYSLINLITKTAVAIPYIIYEKKDEDALKRYKSLTSGTVNNDSLMKANIIRKHALIETQHTPLHDLLDRPNPAQSYATFMSEVIAFGKLTGNRFIYGIGPESRDNKVFNELYTLPSHLVEIKSNGIFEPVSKYCMSYGRSTYDIEAEDVLHIADFNPDYDGSGSHLYGQSPLMSGLRTMTSNNEAVETGLKYLQNQTARGILTSEDESLTPTQAQQLKDAFRRNYQGSHNAGDVIVTPKKLSWTNFGLSAGDLQLLETYNASIKDLCNIFSVPVQLLNNTESSTYNNMREAKKALYQNAVIPELDKLRDELNRWLVPLYGDNLFLDFDYSSISELQQEQEKIVEQLTKSYWLSNNEKRQAMGYGLDEEQEIMNDYLVPNSLVPISDLEFGAQSPNFFDNSVQEVPKNEKPPTELEKTLMMEVDEDMMEVEETMMGDDHETHKAVEDEIYDNQDEAMERAREIGCTLTHSHDTDDGTIYMPCRNMDELEQALGNQEKQETYGGYPKKAISNAERAIKVNEKHNNKCATAVGKQRAQDIVANRAFSLSVLKRVYGYLSRAKEYNTGKYEVDGKAVCGTISYNLWGGDSMLSWSERKLKQIENES